MTGRRRGHTPPMEPNPQYVAMLRAGVGEAPFPHLVGMELVDLEFDRCRIDLVVARKHLQPFGIVHGGVLASLVDKSLVTVTERDGEARYRMLDTVDQYATELLDAEGDAPATLQRHAEHYARIVDLYGPKLRSAARPRVMPSPESAGAAWVVASWRSSTSTTEESDS